MIEPFEYLISKEEENEFEKELQKINIEKSKNHIPKLNYNISNLTDEEMFADLSKVNMNTLYLDLIKKQEIDNDTKIKLALEYQDKKYQNYPDEFREVLVRQELNISTDIEKIKIKKKNFDKIIKKELEEDLLYNNTIKKNKSTNMTLERKKVSVYF